MAKAQLEIVVVDKGTTAGRTAPAPSSGGSASSPPRVTPGGPGGDTTFNPSSPPTSEPARTPTASTSVVRNFSTGENSSASAKAPAPVAGQLSKMGMDKLGISNSGLVKLGVAGLAAAVAIKGLEKAADGASKVWQSVKKDIESASAFSGEVAAARAMSDVNMQLAEMQRANQLGPQLARIEKARGELDLKMYELTTDIKAILADIIVPIIEGISSIAEPTLEAVDWIAGIYYEVNRITNPHLAMVIDAIEKIFNYYKSNKEEIGDDIYFEALERAVRSVSPDNVPSNDGRQSSIPTSSGFFA